jgi:hypothetical protein
MSDIQDRLRKVSAGLLLARMEELSEDSYAAGWMQDLEYDLWRIAKAGGGPYGMSCITKEQADELLRLAQDAGGWYEGGEAPDGTMPFTPLAEWEKYFAERFAVDEPKRIAWREWRERQQAAFDAGQPVDPKWIAMESLVPSRPQNMRLKKESA